MSGHDRYKRRVAAEALKQSDNDRDLALDMLMNPTSFATLQVGLTIKNLFLNFVETTISSVIRYVGLLWSLFLTGHLYLRGIWQVL